MCPASWSDLLGNAVEGVRFAGIPTPAIDPPLRRLLLRSRRLSGPGPLHVDHIQHFSQSEFVVLYGQDELYMKFLWVTYAQPSFVWGVNAQSLCIKPLVKAV